MATATSDDDQAIYQRAPLGAFTKEHLIEFTHDWEGERFPDGRPRVADDIIERMRQVTLTQAWGSCRGGGYEHQFEGGFSCTHPGEVLCGRALTATFMPRRPDVYQTVEQQAERGGHVGAHIHWPINALVKGDVYVADMFGKIEHGAIIGDNLAASVLAKSGNGVVHDCSVRDIEGIRELPGFASYIRGWHPTTTESTIMLTGLNGPTRIGGVTVMPGDVVLGKGDSVVFIPPHLADKTVKQAEIVSLRDTFGKLRLTEGTYLPGQIDGRWGDDVEKDFSVWLEDHIDDLPVPKHAVQDYLKERTW
jgi:4-hydroxy-4-methyl-2-oxoglutarate aldolase